MPVLLRFVDCVVVRGTYKAEIQCPNKDNYVTVWFIVGINTEIVPQNQCFQLPIVEVTESHWTSAQDLKCSHSTQCEA